jgi:hypothetical protein
MTPTAITTCDAFADGLNAVLDGDAPRTLLTESVHYPACGDCQGLYAAAVLLQATPFAAPSPPTHFVDTVLDAVATSEVAVRQTRRRNLVTLASLATLAAAVLVAFNLTIAPAEQGTAPVAVIPAKPAPMPSVQQSVNDAKVAVATLSEQVLDETVTPARNLIFASARPTVVTATEPLAELPEAAKAGIEPITNTTRRAFGTLIRDAQNIAAVAK